MSFSSEVKNELKIKSFTLKNRHSKIGSDGQNGNRRDRLIGAFLKYGRLSDPRKNYHLEFSGMGQEETENILELLRDAGIQAGLSERKGKQLVYLKEGEAISDVLKLMGASNALLAFENVRILKEFRENIQRQVNCETANLQKTVSASLKQTEDIRYLDKAIGIGRLPESLQEAAMLRLSFPEATLQELADEAEGRITRSGINHRLRRLSRMADQLREAGKARLT